MPKRYQSDSLIGRLDGEEGLSRRLTLCTKGSLMQSKLGSRSLARRKAGQALMAAKPSKTAIENAQRFALLRERESPRRGPLLSLSPVAADLLRQAAGAKGGADARLLAQAAVSAVAAIHLGEKSSPENIQELISNLNSADASLLEEVVRAAGQ